LRVACDKIDAILVSLPSRVPINRSDQQVLPNAACQHWPGAGRWPEVVA
jgi:hypothetical protein